MSQEFRRDLRNLPWYLKQFIICDNIGHRFAPDLDELTKQMGFRVCDRCMAKVSVNLKEGK
jgi:hypothetical protein